MSSKSPNLTLDEQSFQDLLSAAYTIQAHNDQLDRTLSTADVRELIAASETAPEGSEPLQSQSVPNPADRNYADQEQGVRGQGGRDQSAPNRTEEQRRFAAESSSTPCSHCGVAKPVGAALCANCGREELRPGELLQRKWASMWLSSQEHQGLWPAAANANPAKSGDDPEDAATPAANSKVSRPAEAPSSSTKKKNRRARTADDSGAGSALAPPARAYPTPSSSPDPSATPPSPKQATPRLNAASSGGSPDTSSNSDSGTIFDPAFADNFFDHAVPDSSANAAHNSAESLTDTLVDHVSANRLSLSQMILHERHLEATTSESLESGKLVWSGNKKSAPAATDHTLAENKSFAEPGNDTSRDRGGEKLIREQATSEQPTSANFPPTLALTETFQADGFHEDEAGPLTHPVHESTASPLANLQLILRFHRANLYLAAAVVLAALALLWPVAAAPRRPSLDLWERALISMGVAEAPTPTAHLPGDPEMQVWVDPHTALYYCPGEEQFGKTADGRFASQRDAQLDRFESASRSACE